MGSRWPASCYTPRPHGHGRRVRCTAARLDHNLANCWHCCCRRKRPRWACPSGAQDWPLPHTASKPGAFPVAVARLCRATATGKAETQGYNASCQSRAPLGQAQRGRTSPYRQCCQLAKLRSRPRGTRVLLAGRSALGRGKRQQTTGEPLFGEDASTVDTAAPNPPRIGNTAASPPRGVPGREAVTATTFLLFTPATTRRLYVTWETAGTRCGHSRTRVTNEHRRTAMTASSGFPRRFLRGLEFPRR